MQLALSHYSALQVLASIAPCTNVTGAKRVALPSSFSLSTTEAFLSRLQMDYSLDLPLHIACHESNYRRSNQSFIRHRMTGARAYIEIEDGLFVASPELCLLQLADMLCLTDYLRLVAWMGGTYSLDGDGSLSCREPLITQSSIRRSLPGFKGLHGIADLKRALRLVPLGSASPMESILSLMFALPVNLGGNNLCDVELNRTIALRPHDQLLLRQTHFSCDFYWKEKSVAVEYDSDMFHTGPDRIEADSRRRNALDYAGIRVLTLTREQVRNFSQFEAFIVELAHALGVRLQKPWREHRRDRYNLHNQLLWPNTDLSAVGFGKIWK